MDTTKIIKEAESWLKAKRSPGWDYNNEIIRSLLTVIRELQGREVVWREMEAKYAESLSHIAELEQQLAAKDAKLEEAWRMNEWTAEIKDREIAELRQQACFPCPHQEERDRLRAELEEAWRMLRVERLWSYQKR